MPHVDHYLIYYSCFKNLVGAKHLKIIQRIVTKNIDLKDLSLKLIWIVNSRQVLMCVR